MLNLEVKGMNTKLISIVVPMYFEEEVAEECYKRLFNVAKEHDINYEIIFVNDGSTDRTFEILEHITNVDKHVKVISFSRNFGHQIAITAGIEKAKGDAVVVIDADLQDPPEIIPQMIKLWLEGYEVVYAKRKKRDGETWFKLATAKLFYRFLNMISTVRIPVDTGDFRLMDRKVVDALKKMPEHNRFVRGMISWIGFKQASLEYQRKERFAGETKYPLKKMIKFAMDGILSFSARPLKIIEYIGFTALTAALGIFLFCFLKILLHIGAIDSEWELLIASILFMGGIQLIAIGILGEYVARIYDESKGRPLYIVDREINTAEIYQFENEISIDEQLQKKVG